MIVAAELAVVTVSVVSLITKVLAPVNTLFIEGLTLLTLMVWKCSVLRMLAVLEEEVANPVVTLSVWPRVAAFAVWIVSVTMFTASGTNAVPGRDVSVVGAAISEPGANDDPVLNVSEDAVAVAAAEIVKVVPLGKAVMVAPAGMPVPEMPWPTA